METVYAGGRSPVLGHLGSHDTGGPVQARTKDYQEDFWQATGTGQSRTGAS